MVIKYIILLQNELTTDDILSGEWRADRRGVFMVNLLAIIFDGTKVLIGKREAPDQYIRELTWSFPGGRPTYDRNLEESLIEEVKKKTGVEIKILSLYHARLFTIKPEFMLLYYLAEPKKLDIVAGEKFTEVLWVRPLQVTKYFSTEIDMKISSLLNKLENDPNYFSQLKST